MSNETDETGDADEDLLLCEEAAVDATHEALEPAESDVPPEQQSSDERTTCTVIALGAGRGGAGKTVLAANIAVYLAQLGKRVVAVDADPAGGSLHDLLGTVRPHRGYGEFLRRRAEGLAEIIVDTPIAGVGLVAGEAQAFGSSPVKQSPRAVLRAIRAVDADYVVVDLGQPNSSLCIDLWLGVDIPILVALPDPSSVEATYRFIKSAFVRRLRGIRGLERLANPIGPPPAALDLYRSALQAQGPAARLAEEMASYRPRFVVGQTRSLADLKLGIWMSGAAQRRLGHALEYLGHVESDEAVSVAARRRRPLLAEYPESKVAKNVEKIVRRLLVSPERPAAVLPPRIDEQLTHYEILETEPGVSDEEIRRAFRRVKEIYAESSLAIAGLYNPQELAELHARANAAHDVLFAPDRRRQYDLSLPEADLVRAVRAAATHAAPRAAERVESSESVLDPDVEVTGAVLRRLREARGLDLSEIAQCTKIGERHLRSIEEERFSEMPAAVYVRGFVIQYARMLHIDAGRAAANYLRRYHQVRE